MRDQRASLFRHVARTLALLAIAVHLGALTWHPFARSWTQRTEQTLLAQIQASICHGSGASNSPSESGDVPGVPTQKADCFVCKGLAGSCFANFTEAATLAFSYTAPTLVDWVSIDAVVPAPVFALRNRGPPYLA